MTQDEQTQQINEEIARAAVMHAERMEQEREEAKAQEEQEQVEEATRIREAEEARERDAEAQEREREEGQEREASALESLAGLLLGADAVEKASRLAGAGAGATGAAMDSENARRAGEGLDPMTQQEALEVGSRMVERASGHESAASTSPPSPTPAAEQEAPQDRGTPSRGR